MQRLALISLGLGFSQSLWLSKRQVSPLPTCYQQLHTGAADLLAQTQLSSDVSLLYMDWFVAGGMNEQVVREVEAAGGYVAIQSAMDGILHRVLGTNE